MRAVRGLALGSILLMSAAHPRADDLSALLERVSARVADYYANAQTIVVQEAIRVQHEDDRLQRIGFATSLVYDDHVEWTPPSDGHPAQASVVRQLLKVNNRDPKPPRKDDDWRCFQNVSTSAEPLNMLLEDRRSSYVFSLAGKGKTDGHDSLLLDYRAAVRGTPKVTWDDHCVSIDLPGRERGRIWIDAKTYDVIRVDEEIVGNFPIEIPEFKDEPLRRNNTMTLQHASTSTRFQLKKFDDPDELLLVPRSIESVDRWTGNDNIRITQSFSNYRRFMGNSHIVSGQDR